MLLALAASKGQKPPLLAFGVTAGPETLVCPYLLVQGRVRAGVRHARLYVDEHDKRPMRVRVQITSAITEAGLYEREELAFERLT